MAEPTTAEKIRGLRWILAASALGAIFVQMIFGPVFVLFLDELRMPKDRIGFIQSLFPFCGLLALFVAPVVTRVGLRRIFICFYSIRKVTIFFLVLCPWILSKFGLGPTFVYVVVIIFIFAICRAVAETAQSSWAQEYVPNSMRGRFSAIATVTSNVFAIGALAAATVVIRHSEGLNGYVILIAVASIIGLISVLLYIPVPGGKPVVGRSAQTDHWKEMSGALRDRNYLTYLLSWGLMMMAAGAMMTFVPLFMKEHVELSADNVVSLEVSALVGTMLSTYLWGWAADRYGGKPVLVSAVGILALTPTCWMLMPRGIGWSYYAALGIAFVYGVGIIGAMHGGAILRYNVLVPPEKKTGYLAIYYAWTGVVGGLAPLLAGSMLVALASLKGQFFIFKIDPYTPLFGTSLLFLTGSVILCRRIVARSDMPTRRFVSLFVQGNPLSAFGAMIRYNLARDESARLSVTERLGETKSPLNVDQLLEALSDPSFNVRYEAIVSVARTRPDERLIDQLIAILRSREPDLSIAATWALGRIKASRGKATGPLREALDSDYPLLQARSARELANLGDAEIIPKLLDRFRNEQDYALRVAFGSALGVLCCEAAIEPIFGVLQTARTDTVRNELTLALARIVGAEHRFMSLWRRTRDDTGTATSQAMSAIKKQWKKIRPDYGEFNRSVSSCANALASNDLRAGAIMLADVLDNLLPCADNFPTAAAAVLRLCADQLRAFDPARKEYLLLALHALRCGLDQMQENQRRNKE